MEVTFPGVKAVVTTTAIRLSAHTEMTRAIVLQDGMHFYGTVVAKTSS